jgi:hypothetical protein
MEWVAHSITRDVTISVTQLNFAVSSLDVSNVVETTSPANVTNQNKTPQNV